MTVVDPVVSGSTIIGSDETGALVALDGETGEQRWSRQPTAPVGATLDSAGHPKVEWTSAVYPWTTGVADGTPVAVLVSPAHFPASGLTADRDSFYATAVEIDSGDVVWENAVPGGLLPPDDTLLDEHGLSSQTVLALAVPNDPDSEHLDGLAGIDLATGETTWEVAGDYVVSALTGGTAIVKDTTNGDQSLRAFATATGAELWHQELLPLRLGEGASDDQVFIRDAAEGTVLLLRADETADGNEEMYLVDAASGRTLTKTTTKYGIGTPSAMLGADGRTAFLFDSGERTVSALSVNGDDWTVELPALDPQADQSLLGVDEDGNVLIRSAGVVTLDAATGDPIGDVLPDPDGSTNPLVDVAQQPRLLLTTDDQDVRYDPSTRTVTSGPTAD